jgi:hypothetical protein
MLVSLFPDHRIQCRNFKTVKFYYVLELNIAKCFWRKYLNNRKYCDCKPSKFVGTLVAFFMVLDVMEVLKVHLDP